MNQSERRRWHRSHVQAYSSVLDPETRKAISIIENTFGPVEVVAIYDNRKGNSK